MTRSKPAVRLAAAALGVALASGGLAVVTTPTATGAPGDTTKVRITKRNVVRMPTTLAPGLHRIVVRSSGASDFQLVKPARGYTKQQLADDVTEGFEGDAKAFRRFERNTLLIGGVSADTGEKGVMWAKLGRGRYWAFDTNPTRFLADKMLTVRVRGDRQRGALPAAPALVADGTTSFAPDPAAIPARGKVTLRNESDANHFFAIARLKKGRTLADVDAWIEEIQNGNEGPSPIRFGVGTQSGAVSPDRAMTLTYDLPPGEYVLLCFWPMPEHDFMPHMFMGMYRQLTLS